MAQSTFPKTEEQILAFWQEKKIFEQTITQNAPKGDFVFYDGPPFATGVPHYGHIIAGTIKDVIPRYKAMQGYCVARRWGWDCHGLPIENLIEQEKGFKEKKEIERDIAGFNQACRDSVLRYRDEWKKLVDRTGRWVDMEHDYRTMDNRYIEVIWWIFKELWKEGLIYEGYKSMHLCPRCETTLSNFEVTLGYKEVKDWGVTVKFEVKTQNSKLKTTTQNSKVYMLAWTTTGWTLPGNMALAVGEEIEYVLMKIRPQAGVNIPEMKDEYVIIAKNVLNEERRTDNGGYPFLPYVLDSVTSEFGSIVQFKGKELIDLKYEPLFDFSREQVKDDPNFQNAFKVYAADFVSTEEGTGIVHIAPAFGEDDYQLLFKENLPFLQHVNHDGTFKEYVSFAPGKKVKTKEDPTGADVEVIKYLAAHSMLFKKEKYAHSYHHCWRCDTPLINYAASSWFVKVTALKDRLLEANSKVNWVPEHIRDGRFGKWLEGARDWAISRSRYWGAPLPVWRCESCHGIAVIGSVAELLEKNNKTPENSEVLRDPRDSYPLGMDRSCQPVKKSVYLYQYNVKAKEDYNKKQPVEGLEPSDHGLTIPDPYRITGVAGVYQNNKDYTIDLHRPYIDGIVLSCDKCGGAMRRRSEVFDCWFESGSMPYASEIMFSDYKITPQTTRDELRKHIAFPANFIAEGTDQTRGWFYTMMVLAVALYNESPFKNVIVNGIILAEDGQKMSKRLKNYPDPQVIMDKYGADAMRFYLMSSPAVRADSLNFSEKGVDEVYKKVLLLTLNVVNFWKMYGKNSKLKTQNSKLKIQNILDQWILARLNQLIAEVTQALDHYEIDRACRPIQEFINDLSTWYVRRSRDRFKSEGADKEAAVATLALVLREFSKVIAPIAPFLAEHIYQEVGGEKESVHLEEWPQEKQELRIKNQKDILSVIMMIRTICGIGHSLRAEAQIKVRQTLSNFQFSIFNFQSISIDQFSKIKTLIAEELNVKNVEAVERLPEGGGWISKDGVAINTTIDESLKEEYLIRELTRHINNLRKKQGLTITDRMRVLYATDSKTLTSTIEKHNASLSESVLASEVSAHDDARQEGALDIDGEKIHITLLCQK